MKVTWTKTFIKDTFPKLNHDMIEFGYFQSHNPKPIFNQVRQFLDGESYYFIAFNHTTRTGSHKGWSLIDVVKGEKPFPESRIFPYKDYLTFERKHMHRLMRYYEGGHLT